MGGCPTKVDRPVTNIFLFLQLCLHLDVYCMEKFTSTDNYISLRFFLNKITSVKINDAPIFSHKNSEQGF